MYIYIYIYIYIHIIDYLPQGVSGSPPFGRSALAWAP